MTIAVVEFAGRGGLIHYAFQLCRALAAAGAEVTLITDRHYELEGLPHAFRVEKLLRLWDPKPPGPMATSPAAAAFRRLRRVVRALRYYREWVRLVLYLRRNRPDVVQLGDIRFPTDLACILVLRRLGFRLADVCHNVYPFSARAGRRRASRLVRSLFTRLYHQFAVVFVHFDVNGRAFREAFGLGPERVAVIPHGNQALFEELKQPGLGPDALRRDLRLSTQDRVVLFFGTLSAYKGTELLLNAFARIPPLRSGPASLVLAGFPAPDFDLAAHEALALQLGILPRVRFVPRYIESRAVAAWMGLAAAAIFPYREVYQSGALHVAQTFGVPIVATRVGAMEEAVVDGESGLLVPPDDAAALAAAVSRVLDEPGLAGRLGARAREDAFGRFAWDRVAAVILDRYRLEWP